MSHLAHIGKNKTKFDIRWEIIHLLRNFFWSQNFLEVETPLIVKLPGQEPNLAPLPVSFHNEKNTSYHGYLHTSPEYAMKKMLAAGYEKIFSICKCFRGEENFGGLHNPEFTMIEWYRTNADFWTIMDDVESLLNYLTKSLKEDKIHNYQLEKNNQLPVTNYQLHRVHMRDLWKRYVEVNLDNYLDHVSLYQLCMKKKYNAKKEEKYEELFYRIFLNEIVPRLGKKMPAIIHHYPAEMAALAKLSDADPRYAERFELYINGIELANAFSELTDPAEQRQRLEEERRERQNTQREVYDIDEEFIRALALMPPSAGIALGVDRLVQIFTNCENIDDVLVLPASILFG